MPSAEKIHEILGILLKYAKEQHPHMTAEHDEIWLPGPDPEEMTEADRKRVEELGADWGGGTLWHCFV